jgi:hypothetical protein
MESRTSVIVIQLDFQNLFGSLLPAGCLRALGPENFLFVGTV